MKNSFLPNLSKKPRKDEFHESLISQDLNKNRGLGSLSFRGSGFVLRAVLVGLCFGAALTPSAALFVNTFNSGLPESGIIPDGSVTPWSDTRAISGISGPILDITVRLNISGGYNGDLYGYLSYNNTLIPLVNRVGVGTGNSFGYDNSGLNVSFSDSAANNIHFYQSVGGYNITGEAQWKPDGRAISPLGAAPTFDAAGTVLLSALDGMSANGNWTLVMADVSGGGGQATVVSWGVDITAVPEPGQWATIAGALLAAAAGARRVLRSRRSAASTRQNC